VLKLDLHGVFKAHFVATNLAEDFPEPEALAFTPTLIFNFPLILALDLALTPVDTPIAGTFAVPETAAPVFTDAAGVADAEAAGVADAEAAGVADAETAGVADAEATGAWSSLSVAFTAA